MKILITGAAGRLGRALAQRLADEHEVIGADNSGDVAERLDISDYGAVQAVMGRHRPELIVHAAAWTDVDGCAREPERALLINGIGAQNVAVTGAAQGASIIYISSNEVFDGSGARPYYEFDRANPINPYGYSKWAGEEAVRQATPRHMIVRTAWLFAHGGRNFIHAILDAARAGKPLRVVTDEIANPTYNDDLADALVQLIGQPRPGTYHLVNEGSTSRWDFARYVLDRAGLPDTPIARIGRHEWPRPSTPPPYCGLANIAGASIGIRLRPWREAVDAFLAREGLLHEAQP